jgi:hypothetical protein
MQQGLLQQTRAPLGGDAARGGRRQRVAGQRSGRLPAQLHTRAGLSVQAHLMAPSSSSGFMVGSSAAANRFRSAMGLQQQLASAGRRSGGSAATLPRRCVCALAWCVGSGGVLCGARGRVQ